MHPKVLLRTEGFAVAVAAGAVYYSLNGPWWLFLILFLAPDLSMVGYLTGPGYGSMAYNAAHTYITPLLLAGVGLWSGIELAVLGALIWAAHIGLDRLVGYGLKYSSGFSDTHFGRV